MEITKINRQNFTDINKANQPFDIIGKINPKFADGKWTYAEELYEKPYIKKYPNDFFDCNEYIDDPDKAVFFAYSDTECAGQIVLKSDWNKYAFIDDICVAGSVRGQGDRYKPDTDGGRMGKGIRLKRLSVGNAG